MDTQTLSVFRDVAHRLSFAAVAKERGTTPSSISRMIAALEADLKVRLFHRTTRKMVLTEAGTRFLRHAMRILDAAEEARDQARGTRSRPEGLVRLSASTAFGEHLLVPLLADFKEQHPGIQLDLVLSDDNLDLAAHGLDLAIRLGNRLDGDFISTRLFATRYRVCAAPDYLETAPPLGEPDDLVNHRCLLFTLPEFRTCWHFKEADGGSSEEEVAGDIAMSSAGSLLSAGTSKAERWSMSFRSLK